MKNGGFIMKTEIKEEIKKANDWAEEAAEKHNFTKTQVVVGAVIAMLALVGIAYLVF